MFSATRLALTGLILAGAVTLGVAQDSAQAELQAAYEKKVSESWFTDNAFTDDYDVARERAKEQGRPIFAYFTRSYSP